ncbi:MAG: Ig-like domain-containing protein, partial [Methylococcales bacterium]|nr:Ig-like domain-containing protein [Methylococcales bacterium]
INNQIIFNPTDPLLNTMDYTISVDSGIKDLAGNLITTTNQTSFTTVIVDIIKPRVTTTYPADSATDFAVDIDIQVTFSEEINPDTATETSITLYDDSGNPLPGSIFTSVTRKISTIFLESPLLYNKTYTLKVTKGIKDLAGNELETESITTFTTIALLNEGTADTPISVDFQTTYTNGFVGYGQSYYSVNNIPASGSLIIWLESVSDTVELMASTSPYTSELSPISCNNNICLYRQGVSSTVTEIYLQINGANTSAGAKYDIHSAVIGSYYGDGNSYPLSIPTGNSKKYVLFETALDEYINKEFYVDFSNLNSEKLTLRFLSENFKTCQIDLTSEPKQVGCSTISDSTENIIVEVIGENLTNPVVGNLTIHNINHNDFILGQTTDKTFTFPGSYQDLYYKLGNLDPDVNYSIKVETTPTSPFGGSDEIISFYSNDWQTINCEALYIFDADFTFCETKSDSNGKIYMSVSSNFGEGSPPSYIFTASEIVSKELNQLTVGGFTLPTQELSINLDPIEYFNMNSLVPSVYAISLNVPPDDLYMIPKLGVLNQAWKTPLCDPIDIFDLGIVCLTDLTNKTDKDLYIKVYDAVDNSPYPISGDLNIVPIAITDITNDLSNGPVNKTTTVSPLEVYKVRDLVLDQSYEIILTISDNIPSTAAFHVVSGNLDELLCSGEFNYSNNNGTHTNTCFTPPLKSNEIYIVMDLQGASPDSPYTIDDVVCYAPAPYCGGFN